MSHIENERLESFLETICEQVRTGLYERADDMLKAWHENIEEAQENEAEFPPLKVTMAAKVDISAATIETTIGFTARYQTKICSPMRDPNQPDLPGTDPES